MTSSSEQRPLPMRQLRAGAWTRLGGSTVLGDPVTEDVLSSLAARAESAARAQGYAQGWSAGRREAIAEERAAARQREADEQQRWQQRERDRAAEHAAALDALAAALADAERRVVELCDHVEGRALTLAYELVEHLLGRELLTATEQDTVRRAVRLVPDEGVAAVRLHPSVARSEAAVALHGVRVHEDPALEPHDVVVELCDGALIDARLDGALERLREEWLT